MSRTDIIVTWLKDTYVRCKLGSCFDYEDVWLADVRKVDTHTIKLELVFSAEDLEKGVRKKREFVTLPLSGYTLTKFKHNWSEITGMKK